MSKNTFTTLTSHFVREQTIIFMQTKSIKVKKEMISTNYEKQKLRKNTYSSLERQMDLLNNDPKIQDTNKQQRLQNTKTRRNFEIKNVRKSLAIKNNFKKSLVQY